MSIYEIVRGITRESLAEYKKNTVPHNMATYEELKPKQIAAALHGFAQGCTEDEIEVFCDTSLFGNGKEGILFSKRGLYGSDFEYSRKKNPVSQPICYAELSSVSLSDRSENRLVFHYKDGREEVVFGSVYTGFLITAMNQILVLREDAQEKGVKEHEVPLEISETIETAVQEQKLEFSEPAPVTTSEASQPPAPDSIPVSEPSQPEMPAPIPVSTPTGPVSASDADIYEAAKEALQDGMRERYASDSDFERVHYFYRMAEAGNPAAMEQLALCYHQGTYFPKDRDKAVYWILKAAELVHDEVAENREMMQQDAEKVAFLKDNPYIPENGKIIELDGQTFLVLSREWMEEEADHRCWVQMLVRALESGETGILTVGWNPLEEEKMYVSSYFSGNRPLAETGVCDYDEQNFIIKKFTKTIKLGQDQLRYSLALRYTETGVIYASQDCALRICRYEGKHRFQDLETSRSYEIDLSALDSEKVKVYLGNYTLVCIWQEKAYYAVRLAERYIEDMYDHFYKNVQWDPALADVAIIQETEEYDLIDLSIMTEDDEMFPQHLCSPSGNIVIQVHPS